MKLEDAINLGLNKYYADESCKRGHLPWRYVKDNRCVGCKTLYRSDSHKIPPANWILIEERVHIQDAAAVREYCRILRANREMPHRS